MTITIQRPVVDRKALSTFYAYDLFENHNGQCAIIRENDFARFELICQNGECLATSSHSDDLEELATSAGIRIIHVGDSSPLPVTCPTQDPWDHI